MNILSVCFGFLGKGSGGRPHPALCATFPCEGKATLFPPKSGFPQKIFLAILPFSCYDTVCRDDGEWQGRFHAESCRRVQGSWKELRSAPERAMTNRRGAPHTAQASGAKGPLRKLGGNAESFRPRERDRRFFIIQKQLQRLLFRVEDESECAEFRVQSADNIV